MARARSNRPPWWLIALLLLAAVVIVAQWLARQRPAGVDVYFTRYDGPRHIGSLVALRRPAPPGPTQLRLEAALRALLEAPHDPRVGSEIPEGTSLLGIGVKDGVVTVDLSSAFATGGGSTSMRGRVWQVVYTATQFPDASAVQILINGHREEALGGEGILIGAPLRRPAIPPSF